MHKTISYLRVSILDQDLEKFKANVLLYAHKQGLPEVQFIEETVSGAKSWKERKIKEVVDALNKGDHLVTPELSRLGRSLLDVLEILREAKKKGAIVHDIKGNRILNDNIDSKVYVTILGLMAKLQRDFISIRTKEALQAKKAKGIKLGRPKGPGRSKLDAFRDEIINLIKNGTPKAFLARRYKVATPTLWNWLRKNKLLDIKPEV